MVSKEVLYSDIESICRDTSAIFGCYCDLHEFGSKGEAVKLPDFIKKAQDLMGENAEYRSFDGISLTDTFQIGEDANEDKMLAYRTTATITVVKIKIVDIIECFLKNLIT